MGQTAALVEALKHALRAKGITYARVARDLRLSETSVKRMFSKRDFTLKRLDQICELAGIDLAELGRLMLQEKSQVSRLTTEQEKEIVSDKKLLLALCAMNHWTLEQIVGTYDISQAECIRCLAHLDRLGVIDLQFGNRIRLLISPTFSLIPGGPLQQFFKTHVQNEYLDSSFDTPGELMLFVSGSLCAASNAAVVARLRRLANEFTELNRADAQLPLSERQGTSLLVAIRPWEPDAFRALRRPNPKLPSQGFIPPGLRLGELARRSGTN
jgi:transcriptional regulator with XRE-family HTH domain